MDPRWDLCDDVQPTASNKWICRWNGRCVLIIHLPVFQLASCWKLQWSMQASWTISHQWRYIIHATGPGDTGGGPAAPPQECQRTWSNLQFEEKRAVHFMLARKKDRRPTRKETLASKEYLKNMMTVWSDIWASRGLLVLLDTTLWQKRALKGEAGSHFSYSQRWRNVGKDVWMMSEEPQHRKENTQTFSNCRIILYIFPLVSGHSLYLGSKIRV